MPLKSFKPSYFLLQSAAQEVTVSLISFVCVLLLFSIFLAVRHIMCYASYLVRTTESCKA